MSLDAGEGFMYTVDKVSKALTTHRIDIDKKQLKDISSCLSNRMPMPQEGGEGSTISNDTRMTRKVLTNKLIVIDKNGRKMSLVVYLTTHA
jgi:hypothetical protein